FWGLSGDFKRESRRIARLVQEKRLEYSSYDQFREYLDEAEPAITTFPFGSTATRKLFDMLRRLYDKQKIDSSRAFDNAVNALYDKEVKPYVNEAGVLDQRRLETSRSIWDPRSAEIAYLTLLGLVCNRQGKWGAHFRPYIMARQFFNEAKKRIGQEDNLPAT